MRFGEPVTDFGSGCFCECRRTDNVVFVAVSFENVGDFRALAFSLFEIDIDIPSRVNYGSFFTISQKNSSREPR